MGLKRNLAVEEIVWQVFAARFILNAGVDNIVFMGMGEPLDNFDNVMQATRVIADQRGFDIAYSHITVSSAGHADGIRKLAAQNLSTLHLAVSLNAADDSLRSRLMPINRQYPLQLLKRALASFPAGKKAPILIEYVLLEGINDSVKDAKNLAAYLEGLPVRINVIPYNGGSSALFSAPDASTIDAFCRTLRDKNLFVRVRQSRGRGIMAACGQLGASLSGVV
jgi:23S rRNA (adenine2503-C2)-methyltransferase